MICFEQLDELKNFFANDAEKKSFNPVRFINTESLPDLTEIKNFLTTRTVEFIFLSDFCTDDDTFPNLKRLRNFLRTTTRNVCVLPLSEFLHINPQRASNEINAFLNLHASETYTFRIYFLMHGMEKFFAASKIIDPRKKNCVVLLHTTPTKNQQLTIIQNTLPVNFEGLRADGIRQYLRQWETKLSGASILFTSQAVHLQHEKFFGEVQIIADAYELLRKYYGLPAELQKNFGREEQWYRLAELTASAGVFEQAFRKKFKVDSLDVSIFENFGERNDFQQWLIWLKWKLQSVGYAARCAKESSSTREFIAQIYELIFSCADEKSFDELCRERRIILSLMKCLPPDKFLERVRTIEKFFALKILTDSSQSEKLMIFEVLQRFEFAEYDAAVNILRENFPALAAFLSEVPTCAEAFTAEQTQYFRRYRWLKVTNRLPAEFNQLVGMIARRKGADLFALKSRNQIVGEEYSEGSAIFFVDGLGAEYMNFFAEKFLTLAEKFSVTYQIGRSNLPTVTELNKDFLTNRKIAGEVLELDTLKHENLPYPENILNELNLLERLTEKFLRALDANEKIILCADHGTSRLAVLARQTEFDRPFAADGRRIYKNGRFADSLADDENNFETAIEFDDKIIFADYSRFAQQGAPGNEIHGGAAWEEVLVPIITIKRK